MSDLPAGTTPATTPEISTDNGAAIASGIGAVAAAISGIASTVAGAEMAKLADPCIRLAVLEDRLRAAELGLERMITAANFFASANQASVLNSIASWGESAGNAGGKAFPFWLLESGAITNPPEAIACYSGPLLAGIGTAACLLQISAGLPANGTDEPSSTNSGYRLGAGLYRYPGRTGTFRGSTFRSEWVAWRRHQRNNVYSPATGRPNWKARLTAWCGRYRSTWEVWRPGDPIAADSTIGRSIVAVNNFRDQVEVARGRCLDRELLNTQLAQDENARLNQMVLDAGEVGRAQSELDAETLASEERQITTLTMAGVLGLALVVLWDKK